MLRPSRLAMRAQLCVLFARGSAKLGLDLLIEAHAIPAVREVANKLAASRASEDYVKFQVCDKAAQPNAGEPRSTARTIMN